MTSKRRERERRPARRTATREPKRRLLVVCEGRVTEPQYLRGLERWVLLHFRESPGARHRNDVLGLVAEKLPGYHKHLRFDDLASGVEDAERRARALQTQADEEGEPNRNPTTSVYRLTESIGRKRGG